MEIITPTSYLLACHATRSFTVLFSSVKNVSKKIKRIVQEMTSIKDQMNKNGYVIIEHFLTDEEILEAKQEGLKFAQDALTRTERVKFNDQAFSHYFVDSADKVSYFYENDAFDEDGTFKNNPNSLNKVGHALHKLIPFFRRITLSERVAAVCRELGLTHPTIVQSMYIYKNPRIGGEVKAHTDAMFLLTEPQSLYGFWLALDDATLENGCLWFDPGSHAENRPEYRFIRNPDVESSQPCVYRGMSPVYNEANFIPTPVAKGSCILIHGNVVHRSLPNHSDKPRHVYTFHVYDRTSEYSKENWLQTELESIY